MDCYSDPYSDVLIRGLKVSPGTFEFFMVEIIKNLLIKTNFFLFLRFYFMSLIKALGLNPEDNIVLINTYAFFFKNKNLYICRSRVLRGLCVLHPWWHSSKCCCSQVQQRFCFETIVNQGANRTDLKGIMSRDEYFLEGSRIRSSTFWMSALGFQIF